MVTFTRGIDTSSHQEGPNNFTAVRQAGYDWAVQRWGVGTYRDPARQRHIEAIIQAGLIPGAYFVPGEHTGSGTEQAQRFLDELRRAFGNHIMLLVMDAEHSNSFGDPTATQCADFVTTLHREGEGRQPLGYVPRWWMQKEGWTFSQVEAVAKHALWWQSQYPISPNPGVPPTAGYLGWPLRAWQYSDHGSVPGIPGAVDLDVFYGTRAQLASLATPKSTLPAYPTTPTPPIKEVADMAHMVQGPSGAVLLVTGNASLLITSEAMVGAHTKAGIPIVKCDQDQFSRYEKLRVDVAGVKQTEV